MLPFMLRKMNLHLEELWSNIGLWVVREGSLGYVYYSSHYFSLKDVRYTSWNKNVQCFTSFFLYRTIIRSTSTTLTAEKFALWSFSVSEAVTKTEIRKLPPTKCQTFLKDCQCRQLLIEHLG